MHSHPDKLQSASFTAYQLNGNNKVSANPWDPINCWLPLLIFFWALYFISLLQHILDGLSIKTSQTNALVTVFKSHLSIYGRENRSHWGISFHLVVKDDLDTKQKPESAQTMYIWGYVHKNYWTQIIFCSHNDLWTNNSKVFPCSLKNNKSQDKGSTHTSYLIFTHHSRQGDNTFPAVFFFFTFPAS